MSLKKSPYFEIRSGAVDTLHFIVKTHDLSALRGELKRRFEATPEFFARDAVAIDVRRLENGDTIPLAELAQLLEQAQLRPIGVVIEPEQRAWVEASGLPVLESQERRQPPKAAPAAPAPQAAPVQPEVVERVVERVTERVVQVATPTTIIDKPLRSGQQIYAKGDLVVLGLVSYGAEVIAEGNIHIYAPLRGRALAGVMGNHGARIFCTCLEPELISIAGIYRTSETPLSADVLGKSVQIRLEHEKLMIEALRLT
jgi:septum site-determining protein MinC